MGVLKGRAGEPISKGVVGSFFLLRILKLLPDFFGITQAFALLHVVSRQGENCLFISFEMNVSTLNQ